MPNRFSRIAAVFIVFAVAACSTTPDRTIGKGSGTPGAFKIGSAYTVNGVTYVPKEDYNYSETGIASWYGPDFEGRQTANGETFDPNELTAAHPTLPMPSLVRVTNLDNSRSVVVRINDRGPFERGRVIDLSRRAAQLLDFTDAGTAKVRVEIMPIESRAIADAAKSRGYVAPGGETQIAARTPRSTPVIMPVVEDQSGPAVQTASIGKVEEAPLDAPVDAVPLDAPKASKPSAPARLASAPVVQKPVEEARDAASSMPLANSDQYDYAYGAEGQKTASAEPVGNARLVPSKAFVKKPVEGTNLVARIPMPPKGKTAPPVREPKLVGQKIADPRIASIPGKNKDGLFYPAPKVTQSKVAPGKKRIFIQAGSFSVKENASRLKKQLGKIAPTQVSEATVKGKRYYRVRLGPLGSVPEADKVLAQVIPRDGTAHITIE